MIRRNQVYEIISGIKEGDIVIYRDAPDAGNIKKKMRRRG
jgi:hypothetical protein